MDELDEVESLEKLDENSDIKNKILFSVIVVGAMLSVQLGYVLWRYNRKIDSVDVSPYGRIVWWCGKKSVLIMVIW